MVRVRVRLLITLVIMLAACGELLSLSDDEEADEPRSAAFDAGGEQSADGSFEMEGGDVVTPDDAGTAGCDGACGAGSTCTPSGVCEVTSTGGCQAPIAVAGSGGVFTGKICASTTAAPVCLLEPEPAHVFRVAPGSMHEQYGVIVSGSVAVPTNVVAPACAEGEACTIINPANPLQRTLPRDKMLTIGIGSASPCLDYTVHISPL